MSTVDQRLVDRIIDFALDCECWRGNEYGCPMHGPLAYFGTQKGARLTAYEELQRELDPTETISSEDFKKYMDVILDALKIHIAKEAVRQGLWKDYPAEDQSNQIKIKIDRVIRSLEIVARGAGNQVIVDNMLEEFHDIINYAVFSVRILGGTV